MATILALGHREFVQIHVLGGTEGRVVDAGSVSAALEAAFADPRAGLVILEPCFVKELSPELYRRAVFSRRPEVVALGTGWNEVLRNRIRQVAGADLLAAKGTP